MERAHTHRPGDPPAIDGAPGFHVGRPKGLSAGRQAPLEAARACSSIAYEGVSHLDVFLASCDGVRWGQRLTVPTGSA